MAKEKENKDGDKSPEEASNLFHNIMKASVSNKPQSNMEKKKDEIPFKNVSEFADFLVEPTVNSSNEKIYDEAKAQYLQTVKGERIVDHDKHYIIEGIIMEGKEPYVLAIDERWWPVKKPLTVWLKDNKKD